MLTKIKILIVEHDMHDLEMIEIELKRGGIDFISEVVQNESCYRKSLKNFIPDVILSDYRFPSFDGRTAFTIREQVAPHTPFILVSGTIGEENSIELIKNGVTDFVLKDKMFTLNTKLVRALKETKERKEKNRLEHDLKQNLAHLAEAQKLAKLGSWDYDFAKDKLVWSEQLYKIFDTDKQTFDETHGSFLHLIDEADRSKAEQVSKHTRETGDTFIIEYGITTLKGEKRVIQEHGYGVKNAAGNVIRLFGTAQDVTESKKGAAAIQKAYDEKNLVLESIDDGFFATDKNLLVTYWNKKAEILLCIKKEDIVGKNLHDTFADSKSQVFYDNYQKAIRENSTIRFEGFSNRTKKWFAVSAFATDNGLSVYFKDVTERKNDEEKLKASELRYRSLIEQATDTICIVNSSWKFIEINPSGCLMFGCSKEEVLQLSIADLLFEEDLKTNPILIDELKAGKTTTNERRIKKRDGTPVEVELSAKMIEEGRIMVFGRDISKRKEAEKLIKESEAKYRSFFESSMDGILLTVTDGAILSANPAACEIFKMTEDEIRAAGRVGVVDLTDPRLNLLLEERKRTGRTKGELTLLRKDGSKFEAELTSAIFKDSFDQERTSMIIRDISERKNLEKALEAERKRFTGLYLQSPSCMGILKGRDHVFEIANPLYLQLIGKTDIIGKPLKEVLPEMESQGFVEILDNVYESGETFSGNEMLVKFDYKGNGEMVDTYLNFMYQPHRDNHNNIDGILFFAIDATEQVMSRKKIEESEKRYRQIVETAQEGIWVIDENHKTTFVNSKMCEILEYTEAEMIGKDIFYFMQEKEKEIAAELMEQKKDGQSDQKDFKYISKSGKEIWTHLSANPLFHDDGRYKGSLAMVTDITEKKIAEQEMTWLINNTVESFILLDSNLNIISYNNQFQRLYSKYLESNVVKGNCILDYAQPERRQQVKEIYERVLQGVEEEYEMNIPLPDNSVKTFSIKYKPAKDEHEKIIGVFVSAIDVTEKKQYEDKITKAIIKTQEDERYEIGGELHDNVCQILAASQLSLGMLNNSVPKEKIHLLNLCAENIKLGIDETRNLSHRLAPAIFDDTNLEEAFQRLFNNFNVEKKLELSLFFDEEVKNYPLNREVQLNLYRILQEQLRNIIKYAKAKIIEIQVLLTNHKLKMQITDDGIGFDLRTAKKGIGLANMKRRAELFSGNFEIDTSPGNGCSIKINIPLANTNLPIPLNIIN